MKASRRHIRTKSWTRLNNYRVRKRLLHDEKVPSQNAPHQAANEPGRGRQATKADADSAARLERYC